MASSFDVNTVVWVYMEGYPWWPGIIMDSAVAAETLNAEIPPGKQAVMCLPSSAPSVVLVDPSSDAEVKRFAGAEDDADLVAAARASPDCAPAVEEALQLVAGGVQSDSADLAGPAATSEANAEADFAMLLEMDREEGVGASARHAESAEDERRRRKREKKERKRRDRESKREGKRRASSNEEEEDESASDSEGDGDADDYFRSSPHKGHKSGSKKKKKHRVEKTIGETIRDAQKSSKTQSTLDDFGTVGTPKYSSADDIAYYYRKLREGRTRPTHEQLLACADRIRHSIALVDANVLNEEERDETLLSELRPLKSYDVTMEQLKATSIGVVVGTLLKKRFPYSVQQLAQAILLYWFRSLPSSVQRKFTQLNEIDRCSTDTTVGERSEDMNTSLGALGVHIYESFTEEEIYDAPPNVDAIGIAKEIEETLATKDRDERVTVLSMLGDASNTAIRRALLDGKITPEALVENAGDVRSLMRNLGVRAIAAGKLQTGGLRIETNFGAGGDAAGDGALTSPTSGFFSPVGDDGNTFGSPTGRGSAATSGGITTLYACPKCGAHEAQRTVYTVSAHDNFPDILRCVKCSTTWNISDQ